MGNQITIKGASGNMVAMASLGLSCAVYFERLAQKVDPTFNLFGPVATLDERLEPVYAAAEQAAPHDHAVMLLLMNNKTTFGPEDVAHFERAVSEYPDDFNDGPLRVITKFRDLLKEHQTLTAEYVGTTAALTVQECEQSGAS